MSVMEVLPEVIVMGLAALVIAAIYAKAKYDESKRKNKRP